MRTTPPYAKSARLVGAILSAVFLLSVADPATAAFATPQHSEDAVTSLSVTSPAISYGQPATVSLRTANPPAATKLSAVISVDSSVITTVPLSATGTASVTLPAASISAGDHPLSVSLVDTATGATVFATASGQLQVKPATTTVSAKWLEEDGSISGTATGQFGTIPSGTATFNYGGKEVGSAKLAKDGTYKGSFHPSDASSSSSDLTVTYSGDGNHARSTGTAVVTVVCYGPCDMPESFQAFADVSLQHKFHTEIAWMYCQGYSRGWGQAPELPLYKPSDHLTRAAMAAFVYRMEAPKGYQAPTKSPFVDVNPGDPFYKEITWMSERGLSKGYKEPSGKRSYRPNDSLSREAMAAFMYRLEAPQNFTAPKTSPFADLTPKSNFYKEISWLHEAKLSTGTKTATGREYLPKQTLTREAMAAFTYRLVKNYRS